MITAPAPDDLLQKVSRDTLPGRLVHLAHTRSDDPAIREKQLGVWRQMTWQQYLDQVQTVAMALLDLGVTAGDHVAILSENRQEWVFADLAAQAIGARSVGVYPTNPPPEVAYIVSHAQAVVVVCEDQEQVDKLVEVRDLTPALRKVVVIDPRGTRGYPDERLMSWDDLVTAGRRLVEARPTEFFEHLAAVDPDHRPGSYRARCGRPGALLPGRNDPGRALRVREPLDRLAVNGHLDLIAVGFATGGEQAYDGPFYRLRSPEELPGLVAQGRTVAEALDIARDVARKLIEARREREGEISFPTASNRRDYTIVVAA